MPWGFNTSKGLQDYYHKQDEYRKLVEKAEKGDIETVLHAGRHDNDEKASISLDSLTPLPKCPQCGAKRKGHAKKCKKCGYGY